MLEVQALSSNLPSLGYSYVISSGFKLFLVLFRSVLHLGQSSQCGNSVMNYPVA